MAVNLDQKQPGFPAHVLPDYLDKLGGPFLLKHTIPIESLFWRETEDHAAQARLRRWTTYRDSTVGIIEGIRPCVLFRFTVLPHHSL